MKSWIFLLTVWLFLLESQLFFGHKIQYWWIYSGGTAIVFLTWAFVYAKKRKSL